MDSPVGGLRIHTSAGLLTAIEFDAEPKGRFDNDPLLNRIEVQLNEYFAKERTDFDLPLAQDGTEFQVKVWNQLRKIPYGQTMSYSDMARKLGYDAGISRAVGVANGANPIPIVVPCHRVVGADGTLTGYSGGIERKQALLTLENPGLF
ncbi:MAG: methylated-DNA--[protein]-cysteine S-methyltransferase [Aeromicrobium sp.]|nr:MAG: methylated-DNA--[protein]-cysteine S-methyltransferase [Aeromicrobium sp.]